MPRTELIESARKIGTSAAELLERVKQLHGDVSSSLQIAKRQESKLIEKEKAEGIFYHF